MAKRSLTAAVAVLAIAAGYETAWAQAYPTKPVSLVVGFGPGGPSDTIARLIASQLSDTLKQQFLVENRAGAASNIAAELVAKARPDGYTLMIGNVGTLCVNDALYTKLNYSPERDFTVISMTGQAPLVLAVEPKMPAASLKEFVAYAKSRSGEINYASPGVGIPPHFASVMFAAKAGFNSTNVQYRSGSSVIDSLTKGEVQWAFDVPLTVTPQHQAGKLKALAVASSKRWSTLPDVPTFAEQGYQGMEVIGWFALVGPAGLPQPIVEKLHDETQAALANPEIRQKFANIGFEPHPGTTADAVKYVAEERKRWLAVAKEYAIKVE